MASENQVPPDQIGIASSDRGDGGSPSLSTPSMLTSVASINATNTDDSASNFSLLQSGRHLHFIPTPKQYSAPWWSHFRILDPIHHPPQKPGDRYACCTWCGRSINFGKGLAGLKKHISSHEKDTDTAKTMLAETREKKRRLLLSLNATIKKTPLQRKQEVLEATVCWIVEENMPFNIVEKKSFRRMCTAIDPNAPKISLLAVRNEIKHLGDLCKQAIQKELFGRSFALTTDHWTSLNNETYGALTAHYVDDFRMKRCVLHFEVHHGTTTGDALFENLENFFESYQFDLTLVVSVTTDTTGNMNTFGRRLAERGVVHLYCVDHNLHLNAKLAFDGTNLPDSDDAMKAARSQVEYFNSSTQALEKLMQMQTTTRIGETSIKVLQDVKTRWWSTWRMIDRLLTLTPTIDALIASRQVNVTALTHTQRKVLAEVEHMLRPMAKAQKGLEGDTYPTLSMVPYCVWKIREALKAKAHANDDDDISVSTRHLAEKMLDDFIRNRYGHGSSVFHDNYVLGNLQRYVSLHKIVLVATFLDPRFKNLHPFIPQADKRKIYDCVLGLMMNQSQGTQQGAKDDELQDTNDKKNDVMPDASFYADLDDTHHDVPLRSFGTNFEIRSSKHSESHSKHLQFHSNVVQYISKVMRNDSINSYSMKLCRYRLTMTLF